MHASTANGGWRGILRRLLRPRERVVFVTVERRGALLKAETKKADTTAELRRIVAQQRAAR